MIHDCDDLVFSTYLDADCNLGEERYRKDTLNHPYNSPLQFNKL
jgi:hypothetical protein